MSAAIKHKHTKYLKYQVQHQHNRRE